MTRVAKADAFLPLSARCLVDVELERFLVFAALLDLSLAPQLSRSTLLSTSLCTAFLCCNFLVLISSALSRDELYCTMFYSHERQSPQLATLFVCRS